MRCRLPHLYYSTSRSDVMKLIKTLPKLTLKNIRTAKGMNFTGKIYRPVDANLSPEIKELILLGRQMKKQFHVKPEHITQALEELRKA